MGNVAWILYKDDGSYEQCLKLIALWTNKPTVEQVTAVINVNIDSSRFNDINDLSNALYTGIDGFIRGGDYKILETPIGVRINYN